MNALNARTWYRIAYREHIEDGWQPGPAKALAQARIAGMFSPDELHALTDDDLKGIH